MSTRGLYGIRKNGVDKLTYNHFDSYPDGLGRSFVEFTKIISMSRRHPIDGLFDRIELVKAGSEPTPEQIAICKEEDIVDTSVSSQSEKDWYCLLRGLQGNFRKYHSLFWNDKPIFMIDDSGFIKDSLFCEYAYIINLDSHEFEFWKGFQTKPDPENRYGTEMDHDGYYPCKLVWKCDLDRIRKLDVEEELDSLLNEMKNAGKEEKT